MADEKAMDGSRPARWDGPALIRQTALSFDPGDKLNGSLYLCDPAGGAGAAQVDAAIERLRAVGLWSGQPVRQVQDDQRAAYEAQLLFVEACEFAAGDAKLVIARFDHTKFPSSAPRFAEWKRVLITPIAPA